MLNPAQAPPVKVRGSLVRRGNMEASLVNVVGHLHVEGDLKAEKLKIKGECSIRHSCQVNEVALLGSLRTEALQTTRVNSSGYLSVTQEAAAEDFQADGSVRINSLSCARTIHIRLGSRCRIKHMTAGEKITISPSSRLINILMRPFRRLSCETIEGAAVTLYRTTASIVSGEDIIIGPGCIIQEVRYSRSLTVDSKSRVDKIVQINDTGGWYETLL
ncbi:hypothetical protein [Paenibacillus sp. BAC0078]